MGVIFCSCFLRTGLSTPGETLLVPESLLVAVMARGGGVLLSAGTAFEPSPALIDSLFGVTGGVNVATVVTVLLSFAT